MRVELEWRVSEGVIGGPRRNAPQRRKENSMRNAAARTGRAHSPALTKAQRGALARKNFSAAPVRPTPLRAISTPLQSTVYSRSPDKCACKTKHISNTAISRVQSRHLDDRTQPLT